MCHVCRSAIDASSTERDLRIKEHDQAVDRLRQTFQAWRVLWPSHHIPYAGAPLTTESMNTPALLQR